MSEQGVNATPAQLAETDHCGHTESNKWVTAAHSTLHCLSGCVIGEVAGLMIGVSLGLNAFATMGLATLLAYTSGFTLGLIPVMRRENVTIGTAFRIIWIGEVVSIGVMELAMNAVDYAAGGAAAPSIFTVVFWVALALAIPAGFIAAWPVNYWLLSRNLKACH